MLELGQTPPSNDLIKDGSEDTFMTDVIEASKETPVIVDFWAPWCGPCKTLIPALEEEVTAAAGKVKMVKIDVDQNQELAAQMRVQSIPAVFAFVDGQPVDGFMGAKAPSELKEFINKVIAEGGAELGDFTDALAAADEMLASGEYMDAAETYGAILGEDPTNAPAFVGLVKAQIDAGEKDAALEMLENAPEDLAAKPEVAGLKARIALAEEAQDLGETAELKAAVEKNPEDNQSRFDLALALVANGNAEEAVQELLTLFKRDQEWNDDAARQQLFKIFESLGPEDPIALTGRRQLASMLFA